MKNIYRFLVLLLCITLSLSLLACEKKEAEKAPEQTQPTEKNYPELTNEYVQGRWSAKVYIDTLLDTYNTDLETTLNTQLENYSLALEDLGIEVPEKLVMKYVIEFDGTSITQYVEANESNDYFEFLDSFYGAVADYLSDPNVFALCFYENGMTELQEIAQKNDMTVEEFMKDEIEYVRTRAQTTLSETNAAFPAASYTISDNTLTVASEVDSVIYNYSSGMLITDSEGLALAFSKE